ncbi:hypothetical protein [Flavobacterium sp. UBA4197]|uniref:hypothetical protein n=1 Tax=Flavobacterium sp. UBA4197 TaxID=1946546 RepID=UPI00258030EB|nr:hypothetical protein [Flavobacterium sp. UBA4197]
MENNINLIVADILQLSFVVGCVISQHEANHQLQISFTNIDDFNFKETIGFVPVELLYSITTIPEKALTIITFKNT